jgi:hypothetical protein
MNPIILAADLVAILVLSLAVYFRHHGRADLVLAYIGLNIGVFGTTVVMTHSTMAAGLGLGLFGVLSIIRLRSNELSQSEVSYYFAALVIGLVCGLQPDPVWLAPTVAAAVVAVMWIADTAISTRNLRQQVLTVDRVIFDESALQAHIEGLLGGRVRQLTVRSTDLVRDMMVVDVRYSVPTRSSSSNAVRPAQSNHTLEGAF